MGTISGLVLLNKTSGMTSQTAVTRVKRLFGAEKAGHTGTLDPMAEGLLPVLLGRAVKASEFMLTGHKHYTAGLLLGRETDTEDVTGTVLRESDAIPDEDAVLAAVRRFTGEQMQTPPMYSAVRVGGRRLMELAREGKTVEREARPITVYRLSAVRTGERTYLLDVLCSKGTYIRTLCADIGRALGCGGTMYSLCRTEAAGFSLSDAHTLEEFSAMSDGERAAVVLPTERIFAGLPVVDLSDFFAHLARNGQPLYQQKIGRAAPAGARFRLRDAQGFFAVGEACESEEGPVIRPIRQF